MTFTTFAGTPATTLFAGTSFVTTAQKCLCSKGEVVNNKKDFSSENCHFCDC